MRRFDSSRGHPRKSLLVGVFYDGLRAGFGRKAEASPAREGGPEGAGPRVPPGRLRPDHNRGVNRGTTYAASRRSDQAPRRVLRWPFETGSRRVPTWLSAPVFRTPAGRRQKRGGGRDLNPRPPGPQPGALPTELPPPRRDQDSRSLFAGLPGVAHRKRRKARERAFRYCSSSGGVKRGPTRCSCAR